MRCARSARSRGECLDPVDVRQLHVHQDEVGLVLDRNARQPVVRSSPRVSSYPAVWRTSRKSFMFFSLSSTRRIASRSRCGPRGQGEHERASSPGLALDPDPAAVELDEPF